MAHFTLFTPIYLSDLQRPISVQWGLTHLGKGMFYARTTLAYEGAGHQRTEILGIYACKHHHDVIVTYRGAEFQIDWQFVAEMDDQSAVQSAERV